MAMGVGVYQVLASVLLSINCEVALPFLPLPKYSLVTWHLGFSCDPLKVPKDLWKGHSLYIFVYLLISP